MQLRRAIIGPTQLCDEPKMVQRPTQSDRVLATPQMIQPPDKMGRVRRHSLLHGTTLGQQRLGSRRIFLRNREPGQRVQRSGNLSWVIELAEDRQAFREPRPGGSAIALLARQPPKTYQRPTRPCAIAE